MLNFEFQLRAYTLPNPIPLNVFHRLAKIDFVQSFQQAIGIFSDAQTPLAHLLFHYRKPSSVTDTVDHFIVGQHCT